MRDKDRTKTVHWCDIPLCFHTSSFQGRPHILPLTEHRSVVSLYPSHAIGPWWCQIITEVISGYLYILTYTQLIIYSECIRTASCRDVAALKIIGYMVQRYFTKSDMSQCSHQIPVLGIFILISGSCPWKYDEPKPILNKTAAKLVIILQTSYVFKVLISHCHNSFLKSSLSNLLAGCLSVWLTESLGQSSDHWGKSTERLTVNTTLV